MPQHILDTANARGRALMEGHRDLSTADLAGAADTAWVMLAGCLVFMMQVGFTFLEAGFTRTKNSQAVCMKNLVDVGVGCVCWFICGWGFAFGEDNGSGLIGTSMFLPGQKDLNPGAWHLFFFQWTFAAAAGTIISGAMAERTTMIGYTVMVIATCGFIQPIVVHWAWSGNGTLYADGFIDFAGSGVIHMLGGVISLVGCAIVGPRKGKFDGGEPIVPSSVFNVCIGTFILWFGWFGFNAGSTLGVSGGSYVTSARVCACTQVCAAFGGCSAYVVHKMMNGDWDVTVFANGLLAGLVSITAGCSNMNLVPTAFIGIVGGAVMVVAGKILDAVKIDDAVGAFPVHGAAGAWGVLAAGLFDVDNGALNGGEALGTSIKGLFMIAIWAAAVSAPIFLVLKNAGMLRSALEDEMDGLDSHFAHSPRALGQNEGKVAVMPEADVEMGEPA